MGGLKHICIAHSLLFCMQESRLNVDALSKKDVLLLFSVLEGELEARDLVIQALRVSESEFGSLDLLCD